MDILNKIKDDILLFIHEYQYRQPYFVLENYYQYVCHWGSLVLFIKRKDISSIPIEVQKKYLNIFFNNLFELIKNYFIIFE